MSELHMVTVDDDELSIKSIVDFIDSIEDIFFEYIPEEQCAYVGFNDIDTMTWFCDYLYELKSDIYFLESCYNLEVNS